MKAELWGEGGLNRKNEEHSAHEVNSPDNGIISSLMPNLALNKARLKCATINPSNCLVFSAFQHEEDTAISV